MSGTVRAGLVFGLAALLAFIGGTLLNALIPCVGFIVAIVSVIALGWGAGQTAAKTTNAAQGQGTGRGATAGAIGGTVLLIGSVIAFLALSSVITSLPGFEDQLQQALQQNPDANIDPNDAGAFLGIGFGVVGFGCGIMNFVLMLIGGLIGGAMWKGTGGTAAYVPAGGTTYGAPPSGSYIPSQTDQTYGNQTYGDQPSGSQPYGNQTYGDQPSGGQPYGNQTYGNPPSYGNQQNPEGGARVYDPNDPNRPQ